MNRLLLLFRRARIFVLVLGLLTLTVAAITVWRSSALKADKQAEGKRQFLARIRDGVGREVDFASAGATPGAVRASVNSVDNFIFKRSGVKLSGATKTRLAEMEQRTLNGASRHITVSELSDILSAIAFERLSTLTDQEISHIDDSLRGLNDPKLPESFQRGRKAHIKLRASKVQRMKSEEFVEQVKALKDQLGTPGGQVFSGMARNMIANEVKGKARIFSEATPEKFSGIWEMASDREAARGMTPLQAVLLTYSVASDDNFADSEANLKQRMAGMQQELAERFGRYPANEGRFAYGENGFIYSTPLDLVFDERTMNSLLNRLEERTAS